MQALGSGLASQLHACPSSYFPDNGNPLDTLPQPPLSWETAGQGGATASTSTLCHSQASLLDKSVPEGGADAPGIFSSLSSSSRSQEKQDCSEEPEL